MKYKEIIDAFNKNNIKDFLIFFSENPYFTNIRVTTKKEGVFIIDNNQNNKFEFFDGFFIYFSNIHEKKYVIKYSDISNLYDFAAKYEYSPTQLINF